jgi:hypothetical protein
MKSIILLFLYVFSIFSLSGQAQTGEISKYNIVWNSQSKNSGESMPCGGGDIGLNVWVENGELLFYISRSGTFNDNNAFLKLGRIRIKLTPNPLNGTEFRQELTLRDGYIKIDGSDAKLSVRINIWVDVFHPVIHVDIKSNKALKAEAFYENWRYMDRLLREQEGHQNSYRWVLRGEVKTLKDEVFFQRKNIVFYHRNSKDSSIFDITVKQQGLESVKPQMFDPLKDLIFGGIMRGNNMEPAGTFKDKYLDTDYSGWILKSKSDSRSHKIQIYLHTAKAKTIEEWQSGLQQTIKDNGLNEKTAFRKTCNWWHSFWDRSFIYIRPNGADPNSPVWQAGRNYQLFRYMLGCNAFGKYPTKFNGGLFTYDPCLIDSGLRFTPDFRRWGGGTMTAQNQRLVYFPMIKSGDFEMMYPQFDFYLRSLRNAELRSEVYWGHKGACFTEQLENFGLPNCTEYGWDRPSWYDKGLQYNAWLEYQWDTALEFCLMILETESYTGRDISIYIPLIESCLTFFNEHYQYLAKMRGIKTFDANGDLILYPGSACETYKMAYNSTSTIAALKTILNRILELPSGYIDDKKREKWTTMLNRIPPVSFRECNGNKTISPALLWERINNQETPQLYPVFPWGIYGVGKPDLEIAINTWKYDPDAIRFRSHVGWKQDNIFAARLGLTREAAELSILKMKDSGKRFPAFWGPGFDWVPDHNWGGSGMIGLQEMLLQTDREKIFLFPAWPDDWDVHFKLHAPYNTTVEGIVKNGKIELINVTPESRAKNVINLYQVH